MGLGKQSQIPAIYLFLTAITLIAFWQVNQCDFINFDDPVYVTDNVHIRNGITIEAIRWAFTTGHAGYRLPLTWLSHTIDVQLFGLNPHRHHLTNLLFHIVNTLLLFSIFRRMTKSPWKSAFVAALFAIHPLHVESVAWVAERKDVLSTFFLMLTIGAYIRYVEHLNPHPTLSQRERGRSLGSYLAVFAFFALGLMAKPMLVTLPFVLLLLDFWPLKRMADSGWQMAGGGPGETILTKGKKRKTAKKQSRQGDVQPSFPSSDSSFVIHHSSFRSLLLEKIPLFALSALSCIVTFLAQQKVGAVSSFKYIPLGVRIANAFVSYVIYIEKAIWPANLAVLYPHPMLRPAWQVLGAVILLIAITITVIRMAKKFPFLAVGWLWFAGTLVPVSGIVQAGAQSMADRFTYVPLIGLFVMMAWGIPEFLKNRQPNRPPRKELLFASSALVLTCFLIVTWTQVGYWHDNFTLYDHALKVTNGNDIIFYDRGIAHRTLGNFRQAIADYDRAIEINPERAEFYNTRGLAYGLLGNHVQAISDYDRAIQINAEYAEAYDNRGVAYGRLGNQMQAIADYDRAIELNPQYAEAHDNRGVAYGRLGKHELAISEFNRAIEINPEYALAYTNRGVAYGQLGNHKQEIEDMQTAARLDNESAKNFLMSRGVNW